MQRLRTLIAVANILAVAAGPALATTWNVNPGDSIQAAVNAASTGDTIYISAGTYTEQVTLTPSKSLTITGEGRDFVTWNAPASGACLAGNMQGYTGTMSYDISGFTFNVRGDAAATWGVGIQLNRASSGPLSLTIHDNRFVEDRTSGDTDHWGTSMLLCHNRYAGRDAMGNGAVQVYNNIDTTWGGMTMSNSQAYDIFDNVFDGCSNAIYNGHGCPDQAGQTFGDHHIYRNVFTNASDSLHPGYRTPAIDWQYYGAGLATHLPSLIELNQFVSNDTAIRFGEYTDMTYPDHVVTANNFSGNGMAVMVVGDYCSTLNAQGNWWGHPLGPGGAGPGSGDPITTCVDYSNFATAPIPEPVTLAGLVLGVGSLVGYVRRRRRR